MPRRAANVQAKALSGFDVAVLVFYSLLPWFVPMVIATALKSGGGGNDDVPKGAFKAAMTVVFSWTSAVAMNSALARYPDLSALGLAAAFCAMSWILDVALLVPMTEMPMDEYALEIGVRYTGLFALAGAVELVRLHRLRDGSIGFGLLPWCAYKLAHLISHDAVHMEYFASQSVALLA